jgi:hypothetical protein
MPTGCSEYQLDNTSKRHLTNDADAADYPGRVFAQEGMVKSNMFAQDLRTRGLRQYLSEYVQSTSVTKMLHAAVVALIVVLGLSVDVPHADPIFTDRPGNLAGANTSPNKHLWLAACVDTFTGQRISGCSVSTSNPQHVEGTGGHLQHPASSATEVVGKHEFPFSNVTDGSGFVLVNYTMPDASGTVTFDLTCTCGIAVSTAQQSIQVQVEGLVPLLGGPGYSVQGSSDTAHHPENNYATSSLGMALGLTARLFDEAVTKHFGGSVVAASLIYTSESLPHGGLFDYKHSDWSPRHNSHRKGTSADLGIVPLSQQPLLDRSIKEAGLRTPVPDESIANPTADHWHIEK